MTRERADPFRKIAAAENLFHEQQHASVIVPDITSRYYINILNGILHYTEQNNWLVQIANTNVSQEKEIEFIKNMQFFTATA